MQASKAWLDVLPGSTRIEFALGRIPHNVLRIRLPNANFQSAYGTRVALAFFVNAVADGFGL